MSTIVPAKKESAARKKKLSLDYVAPEGDFESIGFGVIDEEKPYSFKVVSPVLITGYHIRNLDNFRRIITAHYSNLEDVTFWCVDFNSEMNDLGDRTKDLFTEYARTKDSIRELLQKAVSDSSVSRKVLFINDGFASKDEEIGELFVQVFEKAAKDPDFHVYLQSHGSRLNRNNVDAQNKIFKLVNSVILVGNVLYQDIRGIFGEEKAKNITVRLKNQNVVYVNGKKSPLFDVYKIAAAWFKKEQTK